MAMVLSRGARCCAKVWGKEESVVRHTRDFMLLKAGAVTAQPEDGESRQALR